MRAMRSGCWAKLPRASLSGYRDKDLPTNSNAFLGFRVVQEVSKPLGEL